MEAVNNMAIPSNVQEQLSLLSTNLSGIKGALIDKGCDIEDNDPLSDYTEKIEEMSTGGGMEKITFSDGCCLLDRNTNWCILVIDTTFGTMDYVESVSIPAETGYLAHNAYTVYRYKREIEIPFTFKDKYRNLPFCSNVSTSYELSSLSSGKVYSYLSGSDAFSCTGLSTATYQYSSNFAQSANIGYAAYENGTIVIYQHFVNTDTYTPTAKICITLEGEIESLT